jgi:hypothetical protein
MPLMGIALLIQRKALGAQGDPLVDAHIVADDAGLADDDPGAMVDETAFADGGPRVNVDAGYGRGPPRR